MTAGLAVAYPFRERLWQHYLDWRGKAAIVVFGDSMTAQGEWGILLDNRNVKNSGLAGLGVVHLKGQVQAQVVRFSPEVCLVMAGINDLTLMQRPVSEVSADYAELLEQVQAAGIRPVVQLTLYEQADPVSKAKVDSLNQWLVHYCRERTIRWVDPNQWLADEQGLRAVFARDKTHLNQAGYEVWAAHLRVLLHEMGY